MRWFLMLGVRADRVVAHPVGPLTPCTMHFTGTCVNSRLVLVHSLRYRAGMTTPAQIRAARALLGWKQAELAAKAGISTNTLNNIERGVADPKLSTVNAIRRALED